MVGDDAAAGLATLRVRGRIVDAHSGPVLSVICVDQQRRAQFAIGKTTLYVLHDRIASQRERDGHDHALFVPQPNQLVYTIRRCR